MKPTIRFFVFTALLTSVLVASCAPHEVVQLRTTPTETLVTTLQPPPADQDSPPGEAAFSLEDHFSLPKNYEARVLYTPPAPNLIAIARSQDGTIFLQHGSINSGVSVFDPLSGEVTRVFDLTVDGPTSLIAGGPGDSVFVTDYLKNNIMLVHADGQIEEWGPAIGAVMYFTEDGRAIGKDGHQQQILQFTRDGNIKVIADGFGHIYDLVVTDDGKIIVSDFISGDIAEVTWEGETRVLVKNLLAHDPIDIGLRSNGQLYFSTAIHGFNELDIENGMITPVFGQGVVCGFGQRDFVWTDTETAVFIDVSASVVTSYNIESQKGLVLVANEGYTLAAAMAPDNTFYYATPFCPGQLQGFITSVDKNGNIARVWESPSYIAAFAFATNGGIYLSRYENGGRDIKLYYLKNFESEPTRIPGADYFINIAVHPETGNLLATRGGENNIYEFDQHGLLSTTAFTPPVPNDNSPITVAGNGRIFVQSVDLNTARTGPIVDRYVLQVDLESGQTDVFFEYPRQGCCPFNVLSSDSNGNVWWLINPEFIIYRIDSSGNKTLFAENLPVDSSAIAVDANENVYLVSPGGIFGFFRTSE